MATNDGDVNARIKTITIPPVEPVAHSATVFLLHVRRFGLGDFQDIQKNVDVKGIEESYCAITQLIDAEIASGTPPERIVLAGFSQGGSMSLVIGLIYEKKLAGLVVLAGRLPIQDQVKEKLSPHATSIPIFWGHGDVDQTVGIRYAHQAMDFLKSVGFNIGSGPGASEGLTFQKYRDLLHVVSDEEIEDVKTWLKLRIPHAEGMKL
ncbi:hypothetical protein AAF712_002596 [Marasmius tenuissimus]|uniref:Acyl-protein thioesterase 1 n=1 Tax=Marasmius tenuissimus TaxID=585030 RepID=A0ABR3A9T2_9AGAR